MLSTVAGLITEEGTLFIYRLQFTTKRSPGHFQFLNKIGLSRSGAIKYLFIEMGCAVDKKYFAFIDFARTSNQILSHCPRSQ